MSYSRREFLKAAGSGVVLTAISGDPVIAAATLDPLRRMPMAREKAAFIVNGRRLVAEYEARTTLWEVVSMKFGLTGTNRSCNRASCGACSVLVEGTPLYSCHTLATEAAGKKIVTIEGVGDEKRLHPLQSIGQMRQAAECGFCTAGWVVTAKALLDTTPNPSEDQVKQALAGHICRCASYPAIVRTVMDSAAVLRGEKRTLEPATESIIHIKLPMVRDYSTTGGHLPGDEIVEGPQKTIVKKWQGYPPENLNVVGKPLPSLPEVAIPRFTGKAQYASRVWFRDLLYVKLLTSPHPRARIKNIDTAAAEKMPGVALVFTHKNVPRRAGRTTSRLDPLPQELNHQGEVVAIAAAETEDLAQDALDAIHVEYEVLPFASTLKDATAPNAPILGQGNTNLVRPPTAPKEFPDVTWASQQGDVEKGFAEADIVKEFTYHFSGGVSVPIQPVGSVAKWDGEKLTLWGMGQGIYPSRAALAAALEMDPSNIRFVNKYNGCTFGAAASSAQRFYPVMAHLAKVTGRPVKMMMPKDQELAQLDIKPETITTFKVGATKDGRIIALAHDVSVSVSDSEGGGHASGPGNAANQLELYTSSVPHWRSLWRAYRTNAPRPGPSRSFMQQETKWSWEIMMDEMADALRIDPVEFRLKHITRPRQGDSRYPYDSFSSVEVLEEGAKAFGWDKRNPTPGGAPGRFKRGFGAGMSQHHGGNLGYHDGEEAFTRLAPQSGTGGGVYSTELELTADGFVTMKVALPDSGSNAVTAHAHLVAEILGFTTRDRIRLIWGDTGIAPSSVSWAAGHTITLQGAATCSAADKLRKDLLQRAANLLNMDVAMLHIRDGVISSTVDPTKRTIFAVLVKANKGSIRQTGRGVGGGSRGTSSKGVGACFVEVEVDTWTGDWRFVPALYPHDTGLVVNPLTAEADMVGSLVESTQVATDPIPWDREFPGTRHYSVGYLWYRLPTIMDVPKVTQLFIDSLEPRWFYGIKGFSETSIGSVPGAIANAIYNACGVRIREHPINDLRYITEDAKGNVRIGAATKLSELVESDLLKTRYPMLVRAVSMISSPELRNASTIGGDLLQEVWCQYLRGGYSCWRNGGYICYGAIGDNSYYHSAMGGRLCYAVYPGDAATALIPFDATVKLATPAGIKELSVEQLVPGDLVVDGRIQSHVVRYNEILTEVILPAPKPGLRASFEKLRPRGVWDFAMASLAMTLEVHNDAVEDARVVFGGIAGKPLRDRAVEAVLKGKTLGADLTGRAVAAALANAALLKYNATKIDMAKGLLASGLTTLGAAA